MLKPERMLCIVGSMNAGGAETFLMKIYRELDKTKYQMDFYVATQEEGFYDKEIIKLGGKIHYSLPKTKNPFKSFFFLRKIVKREKYKNVLRVSQHSLSSIDLIAAKFGGAKNLVFRSSNSKTGGAKLNQYLHKKFRFLSKSIPNIKIAPSTEAANFMFGENSVENNKAYIVNNALDLEKYVFDMKKRISIRKELNAEGKKVFGHIGRFSNQKNHLFLIDIYSEIAKKNPESVLVLIGKGELENQIKEKVEKLNISDKVIFAGVRSDIPDLLMGMDMFLFPSFFEGMPNTVLEAQATGLPCLISNTITKEVNITGLVHYMPLGDNAKEWASLAVKDINLLERQDVRKDFLKNGYDISTVTRKFENLVYKFVE